ncbi:MAG: penicillin-binding protein 2 [Candidatus Omnitrophica bacterium]|nr:penicillin-binding protein 2 [Candidatus Omnitrophota bacterium]
MSDSLSKRRYWFINFFILTVFLVLSYQLIQLTIIRSPVLQRLAERQHKITVEIPPLRGQIRDRSGKDLATNLKVPSIYAIPRVIWKSEKAALAARLSQILDIDQDYFMERLNRDKAFVWLKRKVSLDEAEGIAQLSHPGLGIQQEYKRFYPQGDLLAHVLGFTDIDNIGLESIELSYNYQLQGRAGRRYTKHDALGREIKAFELKSIPAINGNCVTLTIDQYIQYLTERALERAYTEWNALGAWAIVMEAKSGKILAMANRPTFNPNFHDASSISDRRNRAITDMYEPGSVFKIVAVSAALNENKATPEKMIDCENGQYHYGPKVLHDVHPYGMLSLRDVVVKSSNIGVTKIAALLSPAVFQSYVEAFGFGEPTGIDLPGEASGFVRPPSQWSKTSPYNIPIGQEVLVTAIQMTTAIAVIANGGFLVRPYIIDKVQDQTGVVLEEKRPLVRRTVIRPEVARTMREILRGVVEDGTGKKAKIEGIPVGGKTGTAQKILPNGRGYSHTNFMSSFIGFGPVDDPMLVMVVVLDDPKPRYYGGTVAAPVFKEVMEPALIKMGYVPPDARRLMTVTSSIQALPENQPIFGLERSPNTKLGLPRSQPGT